MSERDQRARRERRRLRGTRSAKTMVVFSLMVFIIMTLTMMLTAGATVILIQCGKISGDPRGIAFIVFACVSVIIGTILSRFVGKRPIEIIVDINEATKRVAKGDFTAELSEESIPAIELREMAHNFNVMTRELASTEILRSDFIENVSHEFKTPISAIEGYATLLQRRDLSEEKRLEYADRILTNSARLSSLTGNILLLSRLDHQQIEMRRERFSLDEQIRETLLMLEPQWSDKHIELDIDLDTVDYVGNAELLAQVWQNLIGNAIKFVGQNGRINVLLHTTGSSAQVSIIDNGPGMDSETVSHIYDRFYQADTSRSTAGNGLGLTLVRRIVDLHKGTIAVSSIPGTGTAFTVSLPIAGEHQPTPTLPA